MAKINVESGGTILSSGLLQLSGGAAMSSTLTAVTDQNNTASPLKLSTTSVQVVSPLRVTTDDPSDMYLDLEDGSANNRFNITRNTASQQVNLNFASNPAGSTTNVGAIRTYVDGVNLSEVMAFREDGVVAFGSLGVPSQVNFNRSSDGTSVGEIYGQAGGLLIRGGGQYINMPNSYQATIGTSQLSLGASWGIRGSGSTSATTSLLVQNSGGTELFKVRDDGYVNVAATNGMNIGGLYLSGLSYNGTINFGNNDLSIGCDVNGRRVNLYSGNTNILTVFKSATNYGVGISDSGSDYPLPSAVLQANSTTRGFLPPRMTDAQIRAIATPAEGLVAYNTDISHLCVYQAGAWVKLSHSPM